MDIYVVIMAGGVGSRFWPRSRKEKPKQLLNIFGQHTMIQDTVYRLKGLVNYDKIFIITNKVQKALIEEQLPEIPSSNIIAEPVGRNTAPCVGIAAAAISQKNSEAVIITLPADHLINEKEKFQKVLKKGAEFAYKSKGLLTFGIQPSRPDTGYGYINFQKDEIESGVHKVVKFVEKPNLEKANKYLSSGDYLWNSGMFVWRADVILEEMEQHLPKMYAEIKKLKEKKEEKFFNKKLKEIFEDVESISIDYGIMEKSDKVFLVKAEFDWSDVGSWETVYELTEKDKDGNAVHGDVYTKYSKNSYIFSPNKYTAAIGIEDIFIINTDDALLVCTRDKAQDVREVVNHLASEKRNNLT